MEEYAIKIQGVKKRYKLGQIGGGTLTADLQSWWARVRGKEDPNTKIGSDQRSNGETFMALNGIDLKVKKGEALGIIGGNGAGKSTLLKLLSRVTAPTEGTIDIYGRITSMLEVGTGFHGEMTGRENIYLNGAILGMTKAEVDEKMEDIIEFSEVREFIDTPVKRYSSGMYVKLAFSVAAHLDSEIMIMDEVLAVGDMAFQKKCLDKMRDAAKLEGRTVLYVSHNMNTIRQLCDRCIVLEKGKIMFDGDVEEAIGIYLKKNTTRKQHNDFHIREYDPFITANVKILSIDIFNKDNLVQFGSKISFKAQYTCNTDLNNLYFRLIVCLSDRTAVATANSDKIFCRNGETYTKNFELDTSQLAPGDYLVQIVAFEPNELGAQIRHDYLSIAFTFTVYTNNQLHNFEWNHNAWGHSSLPQLTEF
ncbi:MAG: ABC transporter ATP-binding protein [Clostridiales bacterium]|nr:ABC transporter ATP-binding protein [Clostridiales bacterium]